MSNKLRVGIATIDITPPVGIPLLGYNRTSPSTGVLDSLSATALVFENDDTKAALLSLDLYGMSVVHTDAIRGHIADMLQIRPQQVMLTFTHTHSGPDTDGDHPLQKTYRQELSDNLLQITIEADQQKRFCDLGWAVTTTDIGENRREITADGQAKMGRNWDGPVDNRIGILRITESDSGDNIAVVVICTAHPNILQGDNLRISADFPGRTCEMLSRMIGCPSVILIGSAADVNPRTRMWRDGNPMLNLDMMAQTISDAVLNALYDTSTSYDWRFSISSQTLDVPLIDLPSLTDAESLAETVANDWDIDTQLWLEIVTQHLEQGRTSLSVPVEVQVLVLGDGTIAGIPMEPFSQLALDLHTRLNRYSQSRPNLVFLNGYTNGLLGNLPTADQYQYGGYEVDWMPVFDGPRTGLIMPVIPETGDQILDTVETLIDQPISMSLDLPENLPPTARPCTLAAPVTTAPKSKRQTSELGKSAYVNLRIEPIHDSVSLEFEWQVKTAVVSQHYLPAVVRGIKSRLVAWANEYNQAIQNIKITVIDGQEHLVDSTDTAFQIAAHRALEAALLEANIIPIE